MKVRNMVVTESQEGSGCATFWTLSGSAGFSALTNAWEKAGLDSGILPKRTSETVALNRAVTEQREKHMLVRKLKTKWSVVAERIDADEDPTYNCELKVGFDDKGLLEFEPFDHRLRADIELAYARALGDCWSSNEISTWLTNLIETQCCSVALRSSGGIYYVPPAYFKDWESMVNAIESSTAHRISIVPALASKHAIRSVLDGIQAEARREVEAFQAELEKDALGQRGYVSQASKCEAVQKKLEYYESFLGEKLDVFKAQLEEARAQLVIASFRKAAEEEGEVA